MSGEPGRAELEAAWLALLSLPSMTPRRLWQIAATDDVVGEWRRLLAGGALRAGSFDPDLVSTWRSAAAALDLESVLDAHRRAGISLTAHGDPSHPSVDVADPHVPPVLLWRGSALPADADRGRAVGIIGTRRSSRVGLDLAAELARELTRAGCRVVSGLALGIDAAAHRGALEVPGSQPVGVVGSGLDIVYPRANRALWQQVASEGVLCSEYPLGTPPAAWRFPARNRTLVALCDAVVVVESHERGGSLITAGIAGERGVPVLAVPGSVRSPTSVGTNRLIADGCQPCLGVDDVLATLGLTSAPSLPFGGDPPVAPTTASESALLDALGWVPRTIDELADACPALGLGELSLAVAALLTRGVLVERDGRLERVR